jgi:hypothetical protein
LHPLKKAEIGKAEKKINRRDAETQSQGSLSGSARFTLLLTDYGQRSIFTANRAYWPHGCKRRFKNEVGSDGRGPEGPDFMFQYTNRQLDN